MDRAALIRRLRVNAQTMEAMSEGPGPDTALRRAAENQRTAADALEADHTEIARLAKIGSGDDAALVARLNSVCLTLYDSEEAENNPIVRDEFRRAQNTVLEAAKRISNLSKIEARVKESQAMHPCSESSTFKSALSYILEGSHDG